MNKTQNNNNVSAKNTRHSLELTKRLRKSLYVDQAPLQIEVSDFTSKKLSRPGTCTLRPKTPTAEFYRPLRGNIDYSKNHLGTVTNHGSVKNKSFQQKNFWEEINAERRFVACKI